MNNVNSQKRTLLFALLGLLVWSSMASITAIYYYTEYTGVRGSFEELKNLIIHTNVLIDYGNETQDWHNGTIVAGSTALDALLMATKNVEYKVYSFGVLVTSIDGVQNKVESPTSGRAWLWYYWNSTASSWTELMKGADAHILQQNDSTAWRYQSYSWAP